MYNWYRNETYTVASAPTGTGISFLNRDTCNFWDSVGRESGTVWEGKGGGEGGGERGSRGRGEKGSGTVWEGEGGRRGGRGWGTNEIEKQNN